MKYLETKIEYFYCYNNRYMNKNTLISHHFKYYKIMKNVNGDKASLILSPIPYISLLSVNG